MEDGEKKSFSFGFSAKKEQKKLVESALKEETKNDSQTTDFITSLEGKEVKSAKPVEEEKELVIPLITANRWRHAKRPEDLDENVENKRKDDSVNLNIKTSGDEVTDQAVRELLKEAAHDLDKEASNEEGQSNIAIPLLLKNKVPDGFETDDKMDVSLRPEESSAADYDQVPIEQFGLAMLRGMGWKEGAGIGKKQQVAKPVDAIVRPKGMGLGADRSLVLQQKESDYASSKGRKQEELEMKKGACCLVQHGKHDGLYGKVEGVDEDNVRAMIKLTLSGETVTLSQRAVRLVGKKEYEKYSKYLNKSKVDKYKEQEERKREKEKHSSHREENYSDSDKTNRKKEKSTDCDSA